VVDARASRRAGYQPPGSTAYGPGRDRNAAGDGRSPYGRSGQPGGSAPSPAEEPRPRRSDRHTSTERGLPGWQALLVLLVIAGIGGAIDVLSKSSVRGGFNVGLVVASVVAILLVRRSNMLTIVVAPPLVYAVASGCLLYIRSGGGNSRKILLDAAVNWLVYGFPAMAAATGAVLIIAAIRLVTGRTRRTQPVGERREPSPAQDPRYAAADQRYPSGDQRYPLGNPRYPSGDPRNGRTGRRGG
jgi:hypothetical protein